MNTSDKIKPIKFKQFDEDDESISNYQSLFNKRSGKSDETNTKIIQEKLTSNFSFEYSYPAVVFDRVCFSVNKSQQQSQFFNELLCHLKNFINPSSTSTLPSDKRVEILKSINLNVPYGSIFGLLGPSSCGKTTLLRCLVGLLKPSSGSIQLFCQEPEVYDETCKDNSRNKRSRNCKVPGSNVGYMPQDLGLYEDFTIRQLLTMFGQYMKMSSKLIETRILFMANFLDLPEIDRDICSLSGGQKRRVSFAIACLHMPPLIILDEPTVGVDPLLRKSIWKYLRRLADEEKKTIIITTHYIEEAAQADQVALMRAGEILVQDTPKRILESNGCKTLEEAFLKICNDVQRDDEVQNQRYKLYPQPRFDWHDKLSIDDGVPTLNTIDRELSEKKCDLTAREKVILFDNLHVNKTTQSCKQHNVRLDETINKLSMVPDIAESISVSPHEAYKVVSWNRQQQQYRIRSRTKSDLLVSSDMETKKYCDQNFDDSKETISSHRFYYKISKKFTLMSALLYKNYRRNVNSLPLLAFQFMLPIIQMISFSLCVGGRPTNIGLGLVNLDQPIPTIRSDLILPIQPENTTTFSDLSDYIDVGQPVGEELLSKSYLSFVDQTMLTIKPYDNLKDALNDVRQAKLWAAMEIGENFTTTISRRFNLDNFYQLDLNTIKQSVIKLYPDRSNKVLDMICHRSLVNSYRKFLTHQFEHFKQLPIEVKEPIFDIKPNLISNSIDGYTESIAAGLLASLTYIMAAGLTTFIMVVERSAGILERTFTSGIDPVSYLLAHAVFRSLVMMIQIAVVMFLTFYILQQPMVGSIWLAYLMLMTLNLTGISYGLLVSSLVTDQNGAALTIVSSLVVKITTSGILWPFEAIPHWLRAICYVQPLTMPVQALKTITLKGNGLEDRTVYFGFLVSIFWLVLFLTISSRRFKFYQH